jgi:SpoVK/Ycf46/Vps4 family AAA+-type ATPase
VVKEAKSYYDIAVRQNSSLVDPDFEQLLQKKIQESGLAIGNTINDDDLDSLLSDSQMEKSKIDFRDVGGLEKIKEEIALKVIHPLKNPDIYKAFGKKIGGGILLYGPPGCGKTLLARATAGEINANFISIGLTEVLDMWVGNSEKNLHEIFQNARRNTPCVLFFDEVDALGASRTDMRQATGRFLINQFLDELDGVKYSNEGILILGATNTPWYLDTAFRRPGRFDRVIFVSPPDTPAREEPYY